MDATQLPLFLETPAFTSRWGKLGLPDTDLTALQWELIRNPEAGDSVEGAGGFRKLRFAPPSMSVGKSGATRVLYLLIPRLRTIVLGIIYTKKEIGTITKSGKNELKAVAIATENELERLLELKRLAKEKPNAY